MVKGGPDAIIIKGADQLLNPHLFKGAQKRSPDQMEIFFVNDKLVADIITSEAWLSLLYSFLSSRAQRGDLLLFSISILT